MRYYKHLYLTEGLEKKKEKIICKLEAGKLQPGVHVLTLAVSERNSRSIRRFSLSSLHSRSRNCSWWGSRKDMMKRWNW